jgi:hypothetical protein
MRLQTSALQTTAPANLCGQQAHPRRVAKVSSAIQRELSQMFIYDPVSGRGRCAAAWISRLVAAHSAWGLSLEQL